MGPGVLGISNPTALLNAVFYLNGKVLCLRGGKEHKLLKVAQFSFGYDDGGEYVKYTENGSKNRSGSYKDSSGDNKIVKQYANKSLKERCYVKLYIQKLPDQVKKQGNSVFYWKAKDNMPLDPDALWFIAVPIGRNQLGGMVKKMFAQVGIEGKTNHSLRATGATRLFESNVPEKLIQDRTGHRSTDAVRMYERSSTAQEKAVSKILCAQTVQKYETVVTASGANKDAEKKEPLSTSALSQMFTN